MKELKVGLIGLGFMGTTHFRIYQSLPGVKIAAIADVDPDKRRGDISKVVGNIGGSDNSVPFDLSGMEVYDNALDLINKSDVDIVDICVPTPFHAEYLTAALDAGKHVFSEKPLCRNLSEIAKIREAVKRSNKFFNVGMCVRAWPEYDHAKQLIDSGAVGEVKSATFRRISPSVDGNAWENWFMKDAMSGGAALDMHLHDTDFVCHLLGKPVKVTSAGIRGVVSDNAIDQINTVYDFGDGKLVTAEGSWCSPATMVFEMSFHIVCEKATIKLDPSGYKVYWNCGKVESPDCGDMSLPTGWHRELKYFTDCVRDNVEPNRYQTPESVFAALAVVMAEIDSVDKKQSVEVQYV